MGFNKLVNQMAIDKLVMQKVNQGKMGWYGYALTYVLIKSKFMMI